jgi:hypothetical protein
MVDSEMEKIVNKPLKLWAAERAREQVRQLARGLNGAPVGSGKRTCAAEFPRYLLFGIAS